MQDSISLPRFITNSPSGVDLFESRSQEKTAKSISDHIKKGNSDYKLIGLDGEWGSGKSNAISIIEKQLGSEYHLFIYDTWAHQEDLQRRSFLEELTDNLQRNHVVDQKEWRNKLNDLLSRKKVTVTRTIPKLSYAIIASLVVAAIVPITKVISDSLPPNQSFCKFLVAASPLLVAIIVWVIAAIRDKQYWDLTQLFRIYKSQDLEKISDETISESEPSLREFRNWIHNLNEGSSKKIVIVFDNMDRLPPDKIKVIWTLLHTFFSSQPYTKIWIIVPFDRAHIRDAFGNSEDDKEFEKTNHFINKTFPVIFNISPAVFTDWKNFFESKFADAFGAEEKDDYKITRKIFDLYNSSITPRKIIAFINNLVSLKLIWEGQIKLRYIAVFVLNRQAIAESPLQQILNKSFLSKSQYLFAGDDAVSNNMAALLYNVPLEKAAQVTLQREIELAIRQRKINDLKEYAKNPDFLSTLEQIQTEDIEVDAMAVCISDIEASSKNGDPESFQVIWDRVMGRQLGFTLQKVEFSETFKLLILKTRPNQRRRFISYLLRQFHQINDFAGSNYYSVLSGIEKFLKENNIDVDCESLIEPLEVAPSIFVDYLEKAQENYKRYKISCNNDSLEKFFIEKTPNKLDNPSVLWKIKNEYKFPLLTKTLEQNISDGNVTLENIAALFDTYKAVSSSILLSIIPSDQKISELLAAVIQNSNEYYELAAMRIAKTQRFVSQGAPDLAILGIVDEKFIVEISHRIQSYTNYGALLVDVIVWRQPAVITLLRKMTQDSEGKSMDIMVVLPHFNNIISVIEIPGEIMLDRLNLWSSNLKGSLTTTNLQQIIPNPGFYEGALKVNNELTICVFEVASQLIAQTSQQEWQEALKDESSYLVNLLNVLLKSGKINFLPDNVFAAYKDTLKDIAENEDDYNISDDRHEYWMLLYNKSDKIHLQASIKGIRDYFLRDKDISEQQFLFFELLLREQGGLSEKSGDVVRKILVPILVNPVCRDRLAMYKEFYSSVIIMAGNDAFDFIDTFREQFENDSFNSLLSEFDKSINHGLAKDIKIIYSKYYSPLKEGDEGVENTSSVKRIVEAERQLHFIVDNGIADGRDPDEGNQKKLLVKYDYKGQEKEKLFDEGKWLRLP